MPHILLATDFSDASLNAVRFALTHFGARARFTLVHSYIDPRIDDTLMPNISEIARKQTLKGLRSFERKCKGLAATATFARLASPIGCPMRSTMWWINKAPTWWSWAPTVLGEPALRQRVHGSGGEVEDPVVLVPGSWEPGPIKRIILAHDGGPMDSTILAPLQRFAKRKKAEVVVAHVRNNIIALDGGVDRRTLKGQLEGVPVSFVTAFGDSVAATIDEVAAEGRIQLVVAVHRQRGFWKSLLHRSKSKRMALHTHVPLMVLH
ncbi:MAG: universal stress protein [Flavobacteriales bacterium]|nr:universal stress protein [Flavobacteriales bacterium]